jgi:diacylglycerol O-acyltransferase
VVERLSAIDAALIHGEMPEWHGHVTSLLVLDPASMPSAYQFEWFRAALAARLAGVARFGQRVAPAPWGVDRPVWIDDGGFDAEHHIKRLVLHNAGTIEHLFRAAGEVAGHQLEHDRPLWECYVVETRRGRLSALIVKNHHALFDGVGGLESMQAMFDLSAATASEHGEPVSARPPSVRSATPSAVGMLLRSAVRGLVVQPAESVKVARQLIRQALPVGRAVLSGDRPVLGLNAPRNPFPGWISPERTVSGAQLSMQQMKAVRHQADIKLNEVLLAVVGGALRRYLVARQGVSGPSLVANVAVSTRAADEKADSSNKFSVMFATLRSAIPWCGCRRFMTAV